MPNLRASGGIRPSRAMSLVAAIVGAGMLLAVAGFFFGGPFIGGAFFILAWVIAVISIIGYHLWNALSPRGVDHTQFHFDGRQDDENN